MIKGYLTGRSRLALRWAARLGAVVLAAGGVAVLGACSSGPGNSGSTSAPASSHPMTSSASPSVSLSVSAATCQHVSSLRKSLDNLAHQELTASASTQIRKDLTNIETQLAAIRASGNAALSAVVDSVSASVSQVVKAASNLSSPPTAAQVQKMVTALNVVKNNSKATIEQLKQACPNS